MVRQQTHALNARKRRGERGGPAQIRRVVVHTRNDRNAYPDRVVDPGQRLEVREDAVIRSPRPFGVRRFVRVLDIEKEQVGEGGRLQQRTAIDQSAGVHRSVYAAFLQVPQAGENEISLAQRLATRERDAAPRPVVEHAVTDHLVHQLGDRGHAPGQPPSSRRTGLGAHPARLAQVLRRSPPPVDPRRQIVWTRFHACPASDAAVRCDEDLGSRAHTFRIVAPPAGERAALEEDGRADPRAIMHAESLHIEDESGGREMAHGAVASGGRRGGHWEPLFTGPTLAIVRTSGSSMW